MQGTQVQALLWEDSTYCRAAKQQLPMPGCLGACALQQRDATVIRSPCTAMNSLRSPQLEKAHTQQERPSAAKKLINFKNIFKKKSIKRRKETAKLSSRVAVPFCTPIINDETSIAHIFTSSWHSQGFCFCFFIILIILVGVQCLQLFFFKLTNVSKTSCCTSLIYTIFYLSIIPQ